MTKQKRNTTKAPLTSKLESTKKAYFAKNIKGKNTFQKVEITQKQGIFMETFDEPIDSQNENQGLIFGKYACGVLCYNL